MLKKITYVDNLSLIALAFENNVSFCVCLYFLGSTPPTLHTCMYISNLDPFPSILSVNKTGWIWLVSNRRLFVWSLYHSIDNTPLSYNLTLSPSGLKYSAHLVLVYGGSIKNGIPPSVLTVSPEGVFRHWLSAAVSNGYDEMTIDLRGQVSQSLILITNNDFVLATTTCSLYGVSLLQEQTKKTMTIHAIPLSSSHGYMSGLSRLSSLLFSSTPQSESRLIRALIVQCGASIQCIVLGARTLQCWKLGQMAQMSNMEWDIDINRLVAEKMMETIWHLKSDHAQARYRDAVKTWLIDAVPYKSGILVLFAGANVALSTEIHFGLGYIDDLAFAVSEFTWFSVVKLAEKFQKANNDDEMLFALRLASVNAVSYDPTKAVYICGPTSATCVQLPQILSEDVTLSEKDTYHLSFGQDVVLGMGCDDSSCYILSKETALNSLRLLPKGLDGSSMDSDLSDQMTATKNLLKENVGEVRSDRKKLFRQAFVHFAIKHTDLSSMAVADLLSVDSSDLNYLVSDLSLAVVDDFPASDPRWSNAVSEDVQCSISGFSLLLLYQLEHKKSTLELVVNFLKTMKIWPKLSLKDCGEQDVRLLVAEHMEKVACCVALVNATQQNIPDCVNEAMNLAVDSRDDDNLPNLPVRDLFFRKVSVFDDIFGHLVNCEKLLISQLSDCEARIQLINEVNGLMLVCLDSITKRRNNMGPFWIGVDQSNGQSHTLWTLKSNVRMPLMKQFDLCIDYIPECVDTRQRSSLSGQAGDLGEFMLQDASYYGSESRDIRHVIGSLLQVKELNRAMTLAETFKDFQSLVELAQMNEEETKQNLLQGWKEKFAEEKFADYLFQYYLVKGKPSQLLNQPQMGGKDLDKFLASHLELSWMMDIKNDNFEKASTTLGQLALSEEQLAFRKKTLASLAKLSALADDNKNAGLLAEMDHQLELLAHQDRLPIGVVQNAGFDPNNMPPMTYDKLIELYCNDPSGTELSFGRALDILSMYRTEEEFERLKLLIWISALMRDDWTQVLHTHSPFDTAKDTVFHRTLHLLCKTGYKPSLISSLLPRVEDLLLCEQLKVLSQNPNFQYLLKAGDEMIRRWIEKQENIDNTQNDTDVRMEA